MILSDKTLLDLSTHSDAAVRRSLYRFIRVALEVIPDVADLDLLGKELFLRGMNMDQLDATLDYIQALLRIKEVYPDVWKLQYRAHGKKTVDRRLNKFIRQIRFGSSQEGWQQLSSLLETVPINTSCDSSDDQAADPLQILAALRECVTHRENQRPRNTPGWSTYLALCRRIMSFQSEEANKVAICQSEILPIIQNFFTPALHADQWIVTGERSGIAAQAVNLVSEHNVKTLQSWLSAMSSSFIEQMKISQPSQSKDYSSSQEKVAAIAQKWYMILGGIRDDPSGQLHSTITNTTAEEMTAAVDLLHSRQGKPFGAAASLEAATKETAKLISDEPRLQHILAAFTSQQMPNLMETASGPYLLRLLDNMYSIRGLDKAYYDCMTVILRSDELSERNGVLVSLLSKPWPGNASLSELLSSALKISVQSALNGDIEDWAPAVLCLRKSDVPDALVYDVLSSMTGGLSLSSQTNASLDGLDAALKHRSSTVLSRLSSEVGATLLSRLLSLAQTGGDDPTAARAMRLKDSIESALAAGSSPLGVENPMVDVIQTGIIECGQHALAIELLVEQARRLLEDTPAVTRSDLLSKLIPDPSTCIVGLNPLFEAYVDHSIALTNPLGGAVYFIKPSQTKSFRQEMKYDREGLSVAMRKITFTVLLMNGDGFMDNLSLDRQPQIFEFLALSYQLIADQLNAPSNAPLWRSPPNVKQVGITSTVSTTSSSIAAFLSHAASSQPAYAIQAMSQLEQQSRDLTGKAFYCARACTSFAVDTIEQHGHQSFFDFADRVKNMRKSEEFYIDVLAVVTAPSSPVLLTLFNVLMSDATGADMSHEPTTAADSTRDGPRATSSVTALKRLVLLNVVAQTLDGFEIYVPQQRLIFFFKHLVSQLANGRLRADQPAVAEILKALDFVVKLIPDLYGEFWEDLMNALISVLRSPESEIITMHAAFRLCNRIRSLVRADVSEDLQESWKAKETAICQALINLLCLQSSMDDSFHQPLKMVNELLARLLGSFTLSPSNTVEELYPVLDSAAPSLQKAAFRILSQHIVSQQEQVSMDKALEKNYVPKLPEQILSLLVEIPDATELTDLAGEADLPGPLYRYLLSWKLVFAHWEGASYAVRSAYVDGLKEGSYVADLLTVTFELLIERRKAPANPRRFMVDSWTPYSAENPDLDAQWLLSHLYHLALLHVPGLVRGWWRDSCPRALTKPAEAFTEKHFSAGVVAAELAAVAAWDANPDGTTQLEVRTNVMGREATATYPVDETYMAVRVQLPATYPLQPAALATVKRAGADERHWQAWLNTATIAMNFASSSQGLGCVADGLAAWRKNVAGILQGQTECAICMCLAASDGQLPTKRCTTCKNLFHGSCLFKWFKSSNTSSCPLCRTLFNYS